MRVVVSLRRRAGPHGAALHRAQRHPPARRAAPARGGVGGPDGACWTGAPTPNNSRRWPLTGEWPATWCPTSASVTLNFRYAPDRHLADAEEYLRQLLAGTFDEEEGDGWARRRRGRRRSAVSGPSSACRTCGEDGCGAAGQSRMDRRGVVLGTWRSCREFRPGRPAAGSSPGRARDACAVAANACEVLAALIA